MRQKKQYKIEKSPLFKLGNKRKLYTLLSVSKDNIQVLEGEQNYKVYDSHKEGKNRKIEYPKTKLKFIQKKLQKLLCRIEPPDWLKSGVKGRCYIDNCDPHLNAGYILKCDISKFYPSCKREYIFKFFHEKLLMSEDVAWKLVDIALFEEHIPTGAPCSQALAFWAYYPVFEKIVVLASEYNAKMTLYVDDMTFSSDKEIKGNLLYKVKGELQKVGLIIKDKKTKRYGPNDHKLITGVIVTPSHKKMIPNKLRNKILSAFFDIKNKGITDDSYIRIRGMIFAAKQIEPNAFDFEYLAIEKLKKNFHTEFKTAI